MPFRHFTSTAPIALATITRHAGAVPGAIADLWRSHGAGLVGDGFVRLVDPDRALMMLEDVVALPAGVVPVFTTALADIVVWQPPFFRILMFRRGLIDLVGYDPGTFVTDLASDAYLDDVMERGVYREGAARLGVPGPDECFGFTPLLALGGRGSAESLDRCGLWEHIALIVQLAGMPRQVPV